MTVPIPRNKTKCRSAGGIKPIGVAQRLADAPASRYTYKGKRPAATDTYEVDGVIHTYGGRCHPDCKDMR